MLWPKQEGGCVLIGAVSKECSSLFNVIGGVAVGGGSKRARTLIIQLDLHNNAAQHPPSTVY